MVSGSSASGGGASAAPRHRLLPFRRDQFVCHVCWEVGSGALLHCPTCQLDVHVACCAPAHLPETTHFSHSRHPLLPLPAIRNAERRCDGCGATAADGPLLFFSCVPCSFDLCSLCVRSPRHIRHPSHPHILVLGKSSRRSSCLCNGCGQPAHDQILMYRCNACDFDLHQVCVRLPLHSTAETKGHEGHAVSLRGVVHQAGRGSANNNNNNNNWCISCGEEAGGSNSWAYTCTTCTSSRRSFFIHPRCAFLEHRGGSFTHDSSSSVAAATTTTTTFHLPDDAYRLIDDSHLHPRGYLPSGHASYGAARLQLISSLPPPVTCERLDDDRRHYRAVSDTPSQLYALTDGSFENDDVDIVRAALSRRLPASSLQSARDQDAVDRVLALLAGYDDHHRGP